jgi:hypothetical protein
MRRPWLAIVALAIFGVVIGLLAYNAGYSHGLAHSGSAVTVVREPGFFPFGFFAIFFLGFFALRIFFWSSWRRRAPWGRPGHIEDRFDQWHEKQHDLERKN